jgi:cadmium resistance protein CadD (predicted permease)
VPIAIGALKLREWRRGEPVAGDDGTAIRRASGQVLAVSAVTIANGGDNIGIYTPVFAVRAADEVALFGVVFAVMTALWCLAARWLVNHRTAGAPIRRHARRVVPFVLILLGLSTLYEAGSIELLRG